MAYNQSIPQPSDKLRNSQSDLLANFAAIKTLVDINHVTFDVADQGKHKFITFPQQGSTPSFLSGEMGLYNKLFQPTTTPASANQAQIYSHLQPASSGGSAVRPVEIPFTASSNSTFAPNASTSPSNKVDGLPGWTMLPSGMMIQWYTVQLDLAPATAGVQIVTTPVTLPQFNAILTVSATPWYTKTGATPPYSVVDQNFCVNFSYITGNNEYVLYFSKRTTTGPVTAGTQPYARVLVIGY
jgi:hypothetical protein